MGNCCGGISTDKNMQIVYGNDIIIVKQNENQEKTVMAATIIQAYFRGMKTRRELKNQKKAFCKGNTGNEHTPIPSKAKLLSKLPNLMNEKTKQVYAEYGPFQLSYLENLPILGPYLYEDHSIYEGQYQNGLRHGKGTQYLSDGGIFEGTWFNDVTQGEGRLIHSNGDVYIGSWKHGSANGHMELDMKVNGQMTNKMAKVQKYGLMDLYTREDSNKVRNTDMGNSNGLMVLVIKDISSSIQYKERGRILGKTADSTTVHGVIIKWKELEYSLGQMGEDIKESIRMIKRKDKVPFIGLMEECIEDNGKMGNSMGQEFIQERQGLKRKAYGLRESELNGLKRMDNQWKNEKTKIYFFTYQKKNNIMLQILFLKVEQSDHTRVQEILEKHAYLIDAEHPKTGQTLLTVATRKNDSQLIELLADKGASIDKPNKFNQSPLWISSFYNSRRNVDFFISRGANINHQDKKGFTPLMIAAQRGHTEIINVLLNANADYQLANKNNDSVFDLCKDYETLQSIITALKMTEVYVKQPEKFKQKNIPSSQKSTQSKFSTNSHKHEKSVPLFEIGEIIQTPLNELVEQICAELQSVFSEQLENLKTYVCQQYLTLNDAKKRVQQYYESMVAPIGTDNMQFQYENFQFEISRQMGRTLYSLLHDLSHQFEQSSMPTSCTPRHRAYKSQILDKIEHIHEAPIEDEIMPSEHIQQEQTHTRSELKRVESPHQTKDPLVKSKDLDYAAMQKRLENLSKIINTRVSTIKQ